MPGVFESIGQKAEQIAPATVVNGTNEIQDGAGDEPRPVEEIESLCMNCYENGMTRLLLTRIPYFREIVITSFLCDHCGFQNNEIQSAGTLQLKGVRYEFRLTSMVDFERKVVKSDTAMVKFIELDVEVPPGRGQFTNIEGLLSKVVEDLSAGQEARKIQAPKVYAKLAEILTKGRAMLAGEGFPFRVSLDDPAGNSFIEPDPCDGVGKWEKREYIRTPAQNEALGLADTSTDGLDAEENTMPDQVYDFLASCPGCMHPCITHMKMVDIPHFRQVVLMNTTCDACGYKSNDVKTGGEIPEKGRKTTLRVRAAVDLARDILKSESCALECPELGLSINSGTLGGRFTTVEGLLTQVRDDLRGQIFETDATVGAGQDGDSLTADERCRWNSFFEGLDAAIKGEIEFSISLTDPLASSYVQSMADNPNQPDDQMTLEEYERTDEEEEELGLKDMKVEGYVEPESTQVAANGNVTSGDGTS